MRRGVGSGVGSGLVLVMVGGQWYSLLVYIPPNGDSIDCIWLGFDLKVWFEQFSRQGLSMWCNMSST